jgi:predicted deacetylase
LIRSRAQYLLRFDDLCPTMARARWARFETLIKEFAIRPILAVVPENRDPDLVFDFADTGFWGRIRAYEAAGATIALHGFRHVSNSRMRGLVPLHRRSEFAGVEAALQRSWIQSGLQILGHHGLHPRLWVAPRHGFDKNTLKALYDQGIRYVSDGFTSRPIERGGLFWIPQQLWEPVEKRSGLWTVCIHSNTAESRTLSCLRTFLEKRSGQFTSFDSVIANWTFLKPRWQDNVKEQFALAHIMASRRFPQLRHIRSLSNCA